MTDPIEDAEDLTDANAAKPASMSADGVSITNRSVDEQIKYENHVRQRESASAGRLGISFFKTRPPGAP